MKNWYTFQTAGKPQEVVIDLGSVEQGISLVRVYVWKETASSVNVDAAYTVSASEDGTNYKTVGKLTFPNDAGYVGWLDAKPSAAVSARYIKLQFQSAGFSTMGEIEVYSTGDAGEGSADSGASSDAGGASSDGSLPQTGDAGMIGFVLLGTAAVAGGAVAIRRRARHQA